MSKKKASGGATMSLKDFHGGSIPSDLPLPSAPGVAVRSGFDRNISTNWGNNSMRSDLRPRAKSSGAARNIDEKALFISDHAPIGRNFDEDERKPLGAVLTPRQTVSNIRTSPRLREEVRLDNASAWKEPDRFVSNAVSQTSSSGSSSSPMGADGATNIEVNLQTPIGNNDRSLNNTRPNAWGVRKEAADVSVTVSSSSLSGSNAASKLAQASALEKVSSGRWQSKSPIQHLPHFLYSSEDNVSKVVVTVTERANYDTQGSYVERGGVAEDRTQGERELSSYEREKPQKYKEDFYTAAMVGGSEMPPAVSSDISERSKIKLLPRSKPLETLDNDDILGHEQLADSGMIKIGNESNANAPKSGLTVAEGRSLPANRPDGRPKLNLKPRLQPLEQSNGKIERERNTLFGGARPRELVLKERGIDDSGINNIDPIHSPNRVNNSRIEATPDHSVQTARRTERKDQKVDIVKYDTQQRNWRNEDRRTNRDVEKQKPPQDRRPEPDTWIKPIEAPNPTAPDVEGSRHGKVASALELAQAFSRSVSDPKTPEKTSVQKGLPGRSNGIPFSRLTNTRELRSALSSRVLNYYKMV